MKRRKSPEDAALHILRALRDAGHEALFAGGCVRDRLLGLTAKDYDVATDSPPERVAELFPRARHVGAKFGVMIVRKYGVDVEVATFRSEGRYSDGRHPDTVTFGTAEEDAQRRDFTINALFYDPIEDRVIDYVNGRADLEAGRIRTVGDPARRFAEDHLRMLRAVRFAARFDFEIDVDTLDAVRRHAHQLGSISAERIWMELEWMLSPPTRVRAWNLLRETGLRAHLSREWPADTAEDELAAARLTALPDRPIAAALALAATLADRPPDIVGRICRSLRLSNDLADTVRWLVRELPGLHRLDTLDLADLKMLMAKAAWGDLLELMRADADARQHPLEPWQRLRERAAAIDPAQVAPPPLVTGDDLQNLGLSPGPQLGAVLNRLYREQLNEELVRREKALSVARRWIEELGRE